MSADYRRRHDAIRARANQLTFSRFFSRPGDDVDIRIQIASSQNYVNVIGIIGQTTGETARMLYACFDQTLFERRISDEHCDTGIHQCLDLRLIAFDHKKDAIYSSQASYQMRSDSSGAADDEMVSQFAHFSRLAIPCEQLRVNNRLHYEIGRASCR